MKNKIIAFAVDPKDLDPSDVPPSEDMAEWLRCIGDCAGRSVIYFLDCIAPSLPIPMRGIGNEVCDNPRDALAYLHDMELIGFESQPKTAGPHEAVPQSTDPKSNYYVAGGIEVIDVIKAKLTPEQYRGYLLGTMLVYGMRANFKDDFERDCEKMAVYARWLSEAEE